MKKTTKAMFVLSITAVLISCSGVKPVQVGQGQPWEKPYVSDMNGVENLAFDGKGNMFVTGLDGYVYRVEPTGDPFRGRIAGKMKIGKRCLDVDVTDDGCLLVGVQLNGTNGRIARITKDFSNVEFISGEIPGINGMALDSKGNLYIASSNMSIFNPKGNILRVNTKDGSTWESPPVFIETACMTNGVSLNHDETKLIYSCLNSSVNEVDLKTKEQRTIISHGKLQIFDDLDASAPGALWFCYNSQYAVCEINEDKTLKCYHAGELKVPSSCRFGKGEGFSEDFLYITEFGLKGRSLKANGRGVFVLPVTALDR